MATVSDPWKTIPEEFQEYLDLMSKEAADTLLEHKSYDCRIELREGEVPHWGPIYPLSEVKLETLREWLKEMLKSRNIRRSTSSASPPILLVLTKWTRSPTLCRLSSLELDHHS